MKDAVFYVSKPWPLVMWPDSSWQEDSGVKTWDSWLLRCVRVRAYMTFEQLCVNRCVWVSVKANLHLCIFVCMYFKEVGHWGGQQARLDTCGSPDCIRAASDAARGAEQRMKLGRRGGETIYLRTAIPSNCGRFHQYTPALLLFSVLEDCLLF